MGKCGKQNFAKQLLKTLLNIDLCESLALGISIFVNLYKKTVAAELWVDEIEMVVTTSALIPGAIRKFDEHKSSDFCARGGGDLPMMMS